MGIFNAPLKLKFDYQAHIISTKMNLNLYVENTLEIRICKCNLSHKIFISGKNMVFMKQAFLSMFSSMIQAALRKEKLQRMEASERDRLSPVSEVDTSLEKSSRQDFVDRGLRHDSDEQDLTRTTLHSRKRHEKGERNSNLNDWKGLQSSKSSSCLSCHQFCM